MGKAVGILKIHPKVWKSINWSQPYWEYINIKGTCTCYWEHNRHIALISTDRMEVWLIRRYNHSGKVTLETLLKTSKYSSLHHIKKIA